jgi:predicted metal-dependent phosphoesterase TrpH
LAHPLELMLHARDMGFTHLALTDHNTLDGHAAFINAGTHLDAVADGPPWHLDIVVPLGAL